MKSDLADHVWGEGGTHQPLTFEIYALKLKSNLSEKRRKFTKRERKQQHTI